MDVLFDYVIAPQPGEVIPIAELPFHVAPAGFALDDPDLAAIPIRAAIDDLADGAVLDALDRLVVFALVPPLRAGHDAEVFLPGEFPSLDDHAHAVSIHGRRFFHEDMFARLDGRLEVHGTEVRRGGKDDIVHIGQGNQLFVRVEPCEAMIVAEVHFQGLELFATTVHAIRKNIGQRHNLNIRLGGFGAGLDVFGVVTGVWINNIGGRTEDIQDRPGATSPTTDHADPDRIIRGRMAGDDKRQFRNRSHTGHGERGVLEELATGRIWRLELRRMMR